MKLDARRFVGKFKPKGAVAHGRRIFRRTRPGQTMRWRRGPAPPGTIFARVNSLEARLARTPLEVRYAQKLRYHVFYEEMSAVPNAKARLARRDADPFDAFCDHLLVLDHAVLQTRKLARWRSNPRVVGTYRLLRQNVAARHGGFYTQSEYDIAPLIAGHRDLRFLELGRSCVLKPYRNRPTVELLWQAIWSYGRRHNIDVMIGCASLAGTDPNELALPLSYLHHFAAAPPEWQARAHPSLYVDMNLMAKEEIDPKAALRALPPLIRGYLRLGAYIGDGAVVDRQFGTTDVLIIMPMAAMNKRYSSHFANYDRAFALG
jgi:putative hemolysin